VAGIEEGRCGDGGSTEDRASAVRFRGGGGISAVEEVARKLLRVDVVLMVSSVRTERGWSIGTMARAFWWREQKWMEKNWSGSFSGM
jgi:hypothetical protein